MRKFSFLYVMLLLCPYIPWAQQVDEAPLLQKLQQATSDSTRIDIYIDLHNLVFKTDLPKATEYANKILSIGASLNSAHFTRIGYLALARCARKAKDIHLIIQYDKEVLKYSPQLPDAHIAIMTDNLSLARDYLDADQVQNAEAPLMKCLQLSNKYPDSSYRARLLQTYGWYHFKQHETDAAIVKYEEALSLYQALKNEQMIAETKYLLVTALLSVRETTTVPEHLFDAIDIFTRRNSLGRLGDCYGLLGQSYLINGNSEKGIAGFEKAVEFTTKSQNYIQAALNHLDLGRCYLLVKNYNKAKKNADQANAIFNTHKYTPGLPMMKSFWGQYYSALGENNKAEKHFSEAANSAAMNELPDIRNDNNRYWAQHRYKTKNNKSADSLMLSYASAIQESGAVNAAKIELDQLINKNPDLDRKTVALIRLMFSEGGPELLRRLKGNSSLAEAGNLDQYLALNPFSLADSVHDQAVMAADNARMLELEAKYNTRIKDDSLRLQQQNLLIEKAQSKRKDAYFAGAVIVMALLGGGLYMQYQFRKKADRDRAMIELLQGEIHHRLTNNLAIIRRLVDVAGRKGSDKISLQSLQTRVSAIELLHKHLYSGKTNGHVNLQEYLTDLALSVRTTFGAENSIDIQVDSPVSISSGTAEKLGLITNEVITNSIKYAFPEETKGRISIHGKHAGKKYELKIADNGTGMPADKETNFGLKMIAGLSKEIDAEYAFNNDHGTVFTIVFADQKN
ncbi:MAG: hypothetical protein EOO04_16540 [Chitinophagaceae bacterium]|nr:MAG: hypothetical protein EOO04_16540 [Chitinophagaceae bacterium]